MNFVYNTFCFITLAYAGLPLGDWQFYVVTSALLLAAWLIIKPFVSIAGSSNKKKNCNDKSCSGPGDNVGCPFCNGVSIRGLSSKSDSTTSEVPFKLTQVTIKRK